MSSTVVTLLPSYGTRVLAARVSSSRLLSRRSYATTTAEIIAPTTSDTFVPLKTTRAPKKSGTIEDIFSSSLSETPALPQRFSDLKKSLYRENLVASWNEVLEELKVVTDEVASLGQEVGFKSWFFFHLSARLRRPTLTHDPTSGYSSRGVR